MPFLSNPENKSRHKEVGTKKSAQRSRHKEEKQFKLLCRFAAQGELLFLY